MGYRPGVVLVPCRAFVVLAVVIACAACSAGEAGVGEGAPGQPLSAGSADAPAADPVVFETDYVRLAHPPGFVARERESRSGGFRTILAGPELSPKSEPKILVNESPVGPATNEFAADANTVMYRARGGEVVSRRDVDVPGAAGSSIELEIVATETMRTGEVIQIRTVELFFTTSSGVGVSVSVISFDRDFEAARLREVIPTVQAL